MYDEKKLLGVIGLCRGAGKAIVGVPMICEHLRKQSERYGEVKNVIVIEASDTSDNTHKKINDKCAYYSVEIVRIAAGCEELGRALGKSAVAAVAIADGGFCDAVRKQLSQK
jgi:ribosomal protein L7Ae-like RNA K-turn-binding protein